MARKATLKGVPTELVVTITILFLLVIFLITLIPVRIVIPGYRLTTAFKVAWNITSAIVGTIISRYSASEIQKQWLRRINHEISGVRYQLSRQPDIATRWRAVLGISPFCEGIRNLRSTGLAHLSAIATALITAAFVAAVTLTDTTCMSNVSPPRIHSGADNRCTRNVPNTSIERLSPLWEYRLFWDRPDGSAYYATTNLGCPSWAHNLGDINTIDSANYAYARNGVAVQNSAIGAPEILYTKFPKLIEPLELPYGHSVLESNLRTVSHCLPVMARNPITCRPGGNVTFETKTNNNTITIKTDGCDFMQESFEDPGSPFGAMISRLCSTPNAVGQGTIAVGATGIMSLTLAAAIGDTDFLDIHGDQYDEISNGTVKNVTYAASCSIDVKPTIEWRTVTLELKDGTLNDAPSYSKVVSAVKGCSAPVHQPANWTLGDGYAAGAVAALVPPLSEGRYWNGMTNSIFNVALNVTETSERYSTAQSWKRLIRNKPYGFTESNNALEDVFGLITGIAMSQMNTIDSTTANSPLANHDNFSSPVMGNATFACTRVGSGNASALMFTIPPMIALGMAIYLLCIVPRQPTKWKTSRLDDLIAIGLASERERTLASCNDYKRKSGVHGLRELNLCALEGVGTGNEDREKLMLGAPSPSGISRKSMAYAEGVRPLSFRMSQWLDKDAEGPWTAGLPQSPRRFRHDEGYIPTPK